MQSTDAAAVEREDSRQNRSGLGALLDTMLGYFVWAGHFLVIYISTALACQLGLATAGSGAHTTFLIALALVTLAAAVGVGLHALRRYRTQRVHPDSRFRTTITIGNDAIAIVAIAWQLLAIAIVPLCA